MTYDLVKQRFPDAPCVVGARVVETATGREGRIAPSVPGLGDRLRVKFDGQLLPQPVDPAALAYAGALAPTPLPKSEKAREHGTQDCHQLGSQA